MYFGQIVDYIRYKSTVGLSFTFIPDDLVFRTATIFFLEAKWNRLFIWDHLAKRSSFVLIDKSRQSNIVPKKEKKIFLRQSYSAKLNDNRLTLVLVTMYVEQDENKIFGLGT